MPFFEKNQTIITKKYNFFCMVGFFFVFLQAEIKCN